MRRAGGQWGERFRVGFSMLDWRQLRLRPGRCPLCGPTLFIRLQLDPLGIRCLRCAAWPASLGLASVVRATIPRLSRARVHEASSQGPWPDFLRRHAREVVCSEFFDGVTPGQSHAGILCQDLEALTFDDDEFDLCTSTEVLEHVADDAAAFRELRRVLRPGGHLIFTVPLFAREQTIERARRRDGEIAHLLPPEYHGDRIRGDARVLVFREYGRDIVERLRSAGFDDARIVEVPDLCGFGHRASVVVARRLD